MLKILSLSNLPVDAPTNTVRIDPLVQQLRKNGHHVDLSNNASLKYSRLGKEPYFVERLLEIVSKSARFNSDYDVIYASKPSSALQAYLMKKKLHVPFIFDQDDLEGLIPFKQLWSTSTPLVRSANRVVVASAALYTLYQKIRSDVMYIPNTAPLERLRRTKEGGLNRSILWIGSESAEEAELVFEAMKYVRDCTLIVTGRHGETHFKSYRHLDALSGKVTFTGWVTESELHQLYEQSDMALIPFPDTAWYRCKGPGRLMEIIAMELPYVSTVGEPAYFSTLCGTGLIAKPEPKDISEKVGSIISSLDLFKARAKQARILVQRKYGFHRLVSNIEKEMYEL